MHFRKPLLVLAIAMFTARGVLAETSASYVFDKVYISTIPGDLPLWKETDDNPPVSLRQAIRLTDAKRRELLPDKQGQGYRWRRVSASVVFRESDTQCYWSVRYEAEYYSTVISVPPSIQLFVLMDGKLVDPIVRKR